MATVFSWLSSALQSASSWLGSPSPSPDAFDLSYFASDAFELHAKSAFMPPEPPLARLDGEHECWEALLDSAFENFTCPGDEALVPESQRIFSESWRRDVREVSSRTTPHYLAPK